MNYQRNWYLQEKMPGYKRHINVGDVIRGNPWVVQAEMEGVRLERNLWEAEE